MLPQGRLGSSVGPDKAVEAEVAVVGLIAEVAAIGPPSGSVGQTLDQAVVPPLPHEAALKTVRNLDRGPVLRQRAVGVAHGMRVLAHDQRVALPAGFRVGHDGRDRRIHRADEVADVLIARPVPADRALVVERPRRVVAADPAGGSVVVSSVPRFVAKRPDDHRGVVLVTADHARDPVHPGVQVARVVAQPVDEGVRLDIRLGDYIQAQFVGQVEEHRVVGVVRGSDCVEAELLHRHQIRPH